MRYCCGIYGVDCHIMCGAARRTGCLRDFDNVVTRQECSISARQGAGGGRAYETRVAGTLCV